MQPQPFAKEKPAVKTTDVLRQIDTHLLKPVRHAIGKDDSYIQLTDQGHVVVFLSEQAKKITISPDGTRVKVIGKSQQEYRVFVEGGGLPSKLKQWYQYAYEFVQVVRIKTPKFVGKTGSRTEIDGLRYKLRVECAVMVAGNFEATVKFKPFESAPPIVLVIRSVTEPALQ